MTKKPQGQVVVLGVVILMIILAILIPGIIQYIQNESKWTAKEQQTTRAFQLAEGGVERGFQQIIMSTTAWAQVQSGTALAGYNFDQIYSDLSGGQYEIRISSGPGSQQATLVGVGRDASTREMRAIKAVYSNTASNAAVYAMGGIALTSNPGVEWGAVLSPNAITTTQTHPRFYSAGNVSLDPNGPAPPNTDNVQWWSYYPNLPPAPQVDLQAYLSSATAQGHVWPGSNTTPGLSIKDDLCGGASSCTGAYYFGGDTKLLSPSAWISNGAIIVMGNLTLGGSFGNGAPTATLPTNAWKEYGNDWSAYRTTYDLGAPATFPGVNGSYAHGTLTYPLSNVLVHGFLYVQDTFSISGGGNSNVWGAMYVGNSSSLDGSHVKLYYDDTTTILTKNVSLIRQSWQEIFCSWSGTNPTCP